MKVFLSYGHDSNAPLVEDLRRDLLAAGYQPWHDAREIKGGDDWRRSILDGLSDSDWVLGFLSKHSVREPGVCRDELGIAMHVKGGAVATVLLEGEAAPHVPVAVGQVQWFDMSDWAVRKAAGGPAWDAWYAEKRDAILAFLARPEVRLYAGEIAALKGLLDPADQQADVAKLIDGFVGRDWLLGRLEDWRRTATHSRLLWIKGGAGTGKSAFAASLGHSGKIRVIGLNLCAYNADDRRDAGRVLRTLAFEIAKHVADYRRLLLDRLRRSPPEFHRRTPTDLFAMLLAEPLGRAIDGGRGDDRCLVVIDALDETVTDGRSELAEVLAAQAKKLPPWIAFVATSRPDEPIQRQFGHLDPLILDAAAPENLADLRDYVRAWLAAPAPRNGALEASPVRSAGDVEALVARIVAAADGNFLYVRMLCEAVDEGSLALDAPAGLPKSLGGLYERWFRHRFPTAAAYDAYAPLLRVLIAAEHPVPEAWLARMFGWTALDQARALDGLGSLFERRPEGIAPFHKSLRDWLGDPKTGPFAIDTSVGSRHLASALWAAFVAWTEPGQDPSLDEFCLVELPSQMRLAAMTERREILAAHGDWDAVRTRLFAVATSQAKRYAWPIALAWWDMTVSLAGAIADRPADQAYALAEQGDIEQTLGRTTAALKSYRDGLAISERLAASDRDNANWQRDLIVSCVKIAEVFPGEAKAMLTRAQAIVTRLRDDGRLAPVDAWIADELARRLAALASADRPRGLLASWFGFRKQR